MIRLKNPPTNGPKVIFETQEEWKNFIDSMYGSIDDETFVEPEDYYPLSEHEKLLLGF